MEENSSVVPEASLVGSSEEHHTEQTPFYGANWLEPRYWLVG